MMVIQDLTRSHASEPLIKTFPFEMTNHLHELLSQPVERFGRWTCLANSRAFFLLFLLQIAWVTDTQPDRLSCLKMW